MRRAVTFSVKGSVWEQTLGPEVPLKVQIAAFKQKVASGDFGGADYLEIWTSSGRIKRAKSKSLAMPSSEESEGFGKLDQDDSTDPERSLSDKSKSKKR